MKKDDYSEPAFSIGFIVNIVLLFLTINAMNPMPGIHGLCP
jgi:hypothetical protein